MTQRPRVHDAIRRAHVGRDRAGPACRGDEGIGAHDEGSTRASGKETVGRMHEDTTWVSVVIANFDYASYVAEAIDSALALDWPRVEVIVVDDGSTDGSRAVLARYADRVTLILQDNAGQSIACQRGFAACRGDLVVFLDADDRLDPSLIRHVAAAWYPGVSKAQVAMRSVDARGGALGEVFPRFGVSPTPRRILDWTLSCGTYPTPPGSGNVYARAYLERVIDAIAGVDRAADTALVAAAPLFGDVVTIARPLVDYRIHGRNDGAMRTLDAARFAREWRRARRRFDFARATAATLGRTIPAGAFGRDVTALSHRAASFRLARADHPVPGDSRRRLVVDALRGIAVGQGASRAVRIAMAAWVVLVCVLPRPMARRLVEWNFIAASRPRGLAALLRGKG